MRRIMNFIKTDIDELIIIEPKVFEDERGYFFESYNENEFKKNNLFYNFVQDNQSKSTYGVVRGLHSQLGDKAQAKLVRVLEGKVLDVVVDVRKNSKTFGKTFSIELTAENKKQLLIPRGFLHGFAVLSDTVIFSYKCDNFYCKEAEFGVRYNDPDLNIDWHIPQDKIIASEKDKTSHFFKELL